MAVQQPPAHGSPEYLRLLDAADAPPLEPTRKRFRLLSIAEVMAIPAPDFLVEGILPVGALAELHGPPGGGKTFVALDLALSVAAGRPFFGRTVRRGRVIYVLAEGQSGLGVRVRAWMEARGATIGIDLETVAEAVQLLEAAHVAAFCAALAERPDAPVLIIMDTLARCFLGGEENSARDVGLAVAAADRVRTVTGAALLLVHHTRKDGDVERGSIALRGAVETMMSLKEEDDHFVLTCEKQKDGEPFPPIALRLAPVAQSLVAMPPAPEHGPSRRAMTLLEVLTRDFPGDGATTTEWADACAGVARATFYRARGELLAGHLVAQQKVGNGYRFHPTPDGRAALLDAAVSHVSPASHRNSHVGAIAATSHPVGGFDPPPVGGSTPRGDTESQGEFPLDSSLLSHPSLTSQRSLTGEPPSQSCLTSHGSLSETDDAGLYEQIEERRAIQQEDDRDPA